ncbi:Asp23/Gls24 family envelope stress response protein [Yinghuangia soli]|uniref:Asp23/Gls24 family envelope stress response protein n=1 Tax=Yinghuangia soli TaxID=2908204 RepID=A0AA41TZF3_9ACTN|nr:Asp23/Gls24 family envelope stress response protein [Yinghuangia soli]MCF2527220.1 Asp23/Gls24 family envelope stress response protein [Yinghuangia soli]
MTTRYIPAPAAPGPSRSLALAAAEAARQVPGVAYLSPGIRGVDARRTQRFRDPAAGVTVTAQATGRHVRIHLAVYEGQRVSAVAGAVRRAVADALRAALAPSSPGSTVGSPAGAADNAPVAPVTVGVVVTAVLSAPR